MTDSGTSGGIGRPLYSDVKTPCGLSNFLICVFVTAYKTCSRKILRPQVVEPAHPPITIRKKKSATAKGPHNPKSALA